MWEYMGVGLWLNKEVVLFPKKDTVLYPFGPTAISGSSVYACLASEFAKTELSVASAASDTTLDVDSDDDFTDGDYIGVELDDGSIHWTTVNGAPAANVITITTGVASAAAIDRHVYGFTNVVQRPLEIVRAYRRNLEGADPIDTPIEIVSIDEYMAQTNKHSEGPVTTMAVDMQLDDIDLYLWPEPENMKEVIRMWVKWPIQDFDAASDDWDFPRGWGNAIKLNLAIQLAPEYGRKVSPELMQNAKEAFAMVQGADRELSSLHITPNVRSYKARR